VELRRVGAAVGGLLALFTTAAALAQTPKVDSAVFVERTRGAVRSLELADRVAPGDRVVTILSWRQGANGGFTVTNPVPRHLAYQGSGADDEEVSVDGGRTWGRLGELTVGSRLATAEDVTHVRWHIPAAQAASGRIAYSGIVR
jgi:hypothetical protein